MNANSPNSPFSWAAPQKSNEGWDGLNTEGAMAQAAEVAEAANLRQYETDKMIFDVLATGRGPEFMAWLERVTIRQASFVAGIQEVEPGNVTVLPAEQQGFFREGQNSMFRFFEAAIDRAKAGPPVNVASEKPQQGE